MKTFKQFVKEQSSKTQWGTWNSPKWRREEEQWDIMTGLEDRLKRDPVAKLGREIARNPESGTVDSIDDIDSKNKEQNLWGQLGIKKNPKTLSVYKDTLRLNTDMPPATRDRNYNKLSSPKLDYQYSGDVKAHELGHLGSHLIGKDSNEEGQRIRDAAKTYPNSTNYELVTTSLASKALNKDITDYDEWKHYAGQIEKQAKDIVKKDDELAKSILNDPEKLSKLKSTYWTKK